MVGRRRRRSLPALLPGVDVPASQTLVFSDGDRKTAIPHDYRDALAAFEQG
jgi:hypothetical protein